MVFSSLHSGASGTGGYSTVNQQNLTCHILGFTRREEDHRPVQIVWLTRAFQRNAVDEVLKPFLVLVQHLVLLGAEPPWREHVDRHAVRPEFVGE